MQPVPPSLPPPRLPPRQPPRGHRRCGRRIRRRRRRFRRVGCGRLGRRLSVPPSWGMAATPTWLAGMPLATPLPGVVPRRKEGCRWGPVATERRRPGSRNRRRRRRGRCRRFQVRATPQGVDAFAGRRLHTDPDGSGRRIRSTGGPPARSRLHAAHRLSAEQRTERQRPQRIQRQRTTATDTTATDTGRIDMTRPSVAATGISRSARREKCLHVL